MLKDGTKFIDLLNNLLYDKVITSQLEILCVQRRVPLTGECEDAIAVRIHLTVKLVDEYNTKVTNKLIESRRMYIIISTDASREAANNCGELLHTITLAEETSIFQWLDKQHNENI